MEIYLIRHPKPNVESNICYGQLDIDIENENTLNIDEICANIASKIDKIYTSPLQRCKKLALLIANKYEIKHENIVINGALMELNFGEWEGKKWDDINQNILQNWMNDFVNYQVPEGESYMQLYNRAVIFWNKIISNHSNNNSTIAIVTHAGYIRAILSLIQNLELKNTFDIKILYTSVFKISVLHDKTFLH